MATQEDELVHVKVNIGTYSWHDGSMYASVDHCGGDEVDAKLPGNFTAEQIKEYVIAHGSRRGVKLEEEFKQFEIPVSELSVSAYNNNNYKRINQMTLKECLIAENNDRPEKKKCPFLRLNFVGYDKTIEQRGQKRKAEKLAKELSQVDTVVSSSQNPKTKDELIEAITFSFVVRCPYHYGNYDDKDFIERNQKIWQNKLDLILENLVKWVEADPSHLAMLQKVMTEKESIEKLYNLKEEYNQSALESLVCACSFSKTDDPNEQTDREKTFMHKLRYKYLTSEQWLQAFAQIIKLPLTYFRYPKQTIKECVESVTDKSLVSVFPREFLDSLLYNGGDLPDILPSTEKICKMSEDEIEATIAAYVGKDIETLHASLRPDNSSDAGFINETDRLGKVIKSDAELLIKLGIDRHKLADRMQAAILISRRELNAKYGTPEEVAKNKAHAEEILGVYSDEEFPWNITHISWMGTQSDPFHPSFGNPSCSASTDYFVNYPNTKSTDDEKDDFAFANKADFKFGTLLPVFIRRLCFFETTAYRVDPEKAHSVFFDPALEAVIQKHKK